MSKYAEINNRTSVENKTWMRVTCNENMRYIKKSAMMNTWIVVEGGVMEGGREGRREGGRKSADQTHSSAACNAQVN
jgi:hypothetical protein